MSSSKKGFRLMKKPEKSNFVHTCNLLSQYVKEKGGLKDLNLVGISGKTGVSGMIFFFNFTPFSAEIFSNSLA